MKKTDTLDFSTVLASSVHDMKNSLNMFLNTLEEITDQCNPDTCASANRFGEMLYEGHRLNAHLLQLLAIYKMERSEYAINIVEHSVEDFLEECALLHGSTLEPKGVAIDFQCESGLTGFFDRELVEGVIGNVVNNAFRFARKKIRLSGSRSGEFIVLSVDDDGAGYPPHMLCSVSKPLNKLCFRSGSSGLGLYFSAMVAGIHNNDGQEGYIECSNESVYHGGRFSLYLP